MAQINVKIFRMMDGLDVIAKFEEINGFEIKLIEPLSISIELKKNEPVMLLHAWLPVLLLKNNEVILKNNDLITLEPTDDVVEFYINAISKINNDLDNLEDIDDDDDEIEYKKLH